MIPDFCQYCGTPLDPTNFFQKRYGFCTTAHKEKYEAVGRAIHKGQTYK